MLGPALPSYNRNIKGSLMTFFALFPYLSYNLVSAPRCTKYCREQTFQCEYNYTLIQGVNLSAPD